MYLYLLRLVPPSPSATPSCTPSATQTATPTFVSYQMFPSFTSTPTQPIIVILASTTPTPVATTSTNNNINPSAAPTHTVEAGCFQDFRYEPTYLNVQHFFYD